MSLTNFVPGSSGSNVCVRDLTSIFQKEALEYAMYSIQERALPSMIDGFKPVQRFVLYSTIKNAPKEYKKSASISAVVADLGYHHGEASATAALALMASDWNNNFSIIEGRGNFGSRLVQEGAAARYIFARLHKNFDNVFKDIDLAPVHDDPEHIPAKFYVPVIPMVLVNGIQGIATGFSTNILPHDPEWLKKATLEQVTKNKITSEPVVKFPQFKGKIVHEGEGKYTQLGNVSISGLTVTVTEIPTSYDHAKYVAVLYALQDKGVITSWDDKTKEDFKFIVRFRRGSDMSESEVIKALKLSKSFTQNINTIGVYEQLCPYDNVLDLIRDFVDYRMGFLQKRIDVSLEQSKEQALIANVKVQFIEAVNNGTIVLRGKTKAEAIQLIKKTLPEVKDTHITILLGMRIDQMTSDEIERLKKQQQQSEAEHVYWNTTNPKAEFQKDLKSLTF